MWWLEKNLGWRLLALGIGLAIWLSVASEPEMATLISVPVQYKPPPGLEISSRLTSTVQLETQGPSGRLRDLASSRTAVILDFSNVTKPGERTFNITRADTNLPRGVELLRATPAQLRFYFEPRETRTVPVVVRFSGALKSGAMDNFIASPSQKVIVGPASKVRRVQSVTTDPVDLAAMVPGHAQATTTAYITEPEVRFVTAPQVTVKIVLK